MSFWRTIGTPLKSQNSPCTSGPFILRRVNPKNIFRGGWGLQFGQAVSETEKERETEREVVYVRERERGRERDKEIFLPLSCPR